MERQEIERIADLICEVYDEAYFDYMNRILDQVREETNSPHESTPNNLGQVALESLEIPKIL